VAEGSERGDEKMRRINTQSSAAPEKSRWAALAATLLLAAGEVLAQEKQASEAKPIAGVHEEPRSVAVRRVVVSVPDRKLALVENGRVVRVYPVAVGAAVSPSPAGEYKIAQRIPHPTYYAPGIVIPPGKANPLGTRWLGLTEKGYGIHGTNQPQLIGRRASHGCIRMRNRDVEELFELVRVGDLVELHAERTAELEEIFSATEIAAAGGQD
jgi:lipoprotein-anchoring transpeptidase ErfK/SrfK